VPLLRSVTIAALLAAPLTAQTSVSLHQWQTPHRDQGDRNTCITFAALAALEARYKRQGLELDLSEEFASSLEKLNWLHATWSDITGPDVRENQMVGAGGGSGAAVVYELQHWLRVPVEAAMPYRIGPTEHQPPYPLGSTHWTSQRHANTWNLDPANLPRAALNQTAYYSVANQVQLGGASSRDPAVLEGLLRSGYEIVWDFTVHPTTPGAGNPSIWRSPSFADDGAHSMLIVGYDRTSSNPADHFFLAKNSWGPTSYTNHYTRVGYDYVRNQGQAGAYVTAVRTPGPWRELRFLGRRNFEYDGWRGTLDVYHLPHTFEEPWLQFRGLTMVDRRVGTFYDPAGNAFRVNGTVTGDELTFWFKGAAPNMRWDEARETPTLGRMFKLRIVDGDGDELAGIHWDNAGSIPSPAHGDYARRPSTMTGTNGWLSPVVGSAAAGTPAQWLGTWRVLCAGRAAEVFVERRDDLLLSAAERAGNAGFRCWLRDATTGWQACVASCDLASARAFTLAFPTGFLNGTLSAIMLTWRRGVAAGNAAIAGMPYQAGYLVRLGEHDLGSIAYFGSGCGPSGGVPDLTVHGTPELGSTLSFQLANVPGGRLALLCVGLSRTSSGGTSLPYHLGPLGAPGCYVRVDPLTTRSGVTNASGQLQLNSVYGHPSLRGLHVYAQYAVLWSGYNALGLATSDAADIDLGGSW
jgi:hypothetical protein